MYDNETNVANMIAHDTLEHSAKHRRAKSVTWEEEIKAVGALSFVRMGEYDIELELYSLLAGLINKGSVKPLSWAWKTHLNKVGLDDGLRDSLYETFEADDDEEVFDILVEALYWYDYGYEQAKKYWNGEQYTARKAFTFLHGTWDTLKKYLHDTGGVSVYFDTVKQIFRPRHKLVQYW